MIKSYKSSPTLQTDYLLGVYDQHKMGAIRFKVDNESDFLSDNKAMAAPLLLHGYQFPYKYMVASPLLGQK